MNSSDQGNMQGKPAGGNQGSDQANQNQQYAVRGDAEGLDLIGIDGFSYGEVRRLDRQGTSEANRQSSTPDSGSRQGGE